MSEKNVVITEKDGKYQLRNNGISDFALIGILECVLFNLKTNIAREEISNESEVAAQRLEKEVDRESHKELKPEPATTVKTETPDKTTTDLRTRISNAIKAIKSLGGEADNIDLNQANEDDLQGRLNELTDQYKRLKQSKSSAK